MCFVPDAGSKLKKKYRVGGLTGAELSRLSGTNKIGYVDFLDLAWRTAEKKKYN